MSLEKSEAQRKEEVNQARKANESPHNSLTYFIVFAKPPNERRTNAASLLIDNPTNLTKERESYCKDELRKAH